MTCFPYLISLVLSLMVTFFCFPYRIEARFPIKVERNVVDGICKKSQDNDFCERTIGTDRRTPSANMDGLALIAISLTNDQVQQTLDNIPGIRGSINDPIAKERIDVCKGDYESALGKFHGAYSSASVKSYYEVINLVRDGTNSVIDCENIYRRKNPIAVSPITVDNHNVIKLSEIILIIVDGLLPH